MKEEKIVRKLKQGDLKAFRMLVELYKRKVYTIAYDILKIHEDAEDISQEVFLKVYHSIKNFRGESKLSSWIYRITVNLSLNHKRKMKKIVFKEIDEEIINNNPDSLRFELSDKIEKALDTLTERQRITFVLKHYHQLTVMEIADIMGCSKGTIKSQLFRTLKKLQKALIDYKFEY